MKILFCTPAPLTKSLGAAKVVVELAEEMRELGWVCDLVSIKDLADKSGLGLSESLRQHLLEHAAEYDVVDYDHSYLPYPRAEFTQKTLFVARSVLLAHHFDAIPIPVSRSWKSRIKGLITRSWESRARSERIQMAHQTVQEADLINVCNQDDKTELIRRGITGDKIVVLPFGINQSRRLLFNAISSAVPTEQWVTFVGTFDYRKGAREFPTIVQSIVDAVPNARFRLLGTAGMFQTANEVAAHFPAKLRPILEVIPRFNPEELPLLLASCSVGIFPSYIEGMPFGVLEMLAAAVPVFAYDTPGPTMMLKESCVVPRGDAKALSRKVIDLLKDKNGLYNARVRAQEESQQFNWRKVAELTDAIYCTAITDGKQFSRLFNLKVM